MVICTHVCAACQAEEQRELAERKHEMEEAEENFQGEADNRLYQILFMRYAEEATLEEIGRLFALSAERVRQLVLKGIADLGQIDPMLAAKIHRAVAPRYRVPAAESVLKVKDALGRAQAKQRIKMKEERERILKIREDYLASRPDQGKKPCVYCGKVFLPRMPHQECCKTECTVGYRSLYAADRAQQWAKYRNEPLGKVPYPTEYHKKCRQCGKKFIGKRLNSTTCSQECRIGYVRKGGNTGWLRRQGKSHELSADSPPS